MGIKFLCNEKEGASLLNRLAREQFKEKMLAEITFDLQVCKLEGYDPRQYINELKNEIDNIFEKFSKKHLTNKNIVFIK